MAKSRTPGESGISRGRQLPPGVKLRQTLRGHQSWIGRIAWSPDGRLIASPSDDTTIRIWDIETGEVLRTLCGHSKGVNCIAWHPTGKWLASGADDKTVKLWDAESGRLLRSLDGHHKKVWAIAWSPDGQVLASASMDKTIRLWEPNVGRTSRILEGHAGNVTTLAWSPDGEMIASGSFDHTVRLWNPVTCRNDRTLRNHAGLVLSVGWSPSWQTGLLASAGVDNVVRIYEVALGHQSTVLEGHTSYVKALAFDPQCRLLASKGGRSSYASQGDDTVRLWRCDTWAPVAVISEPTSPYWPPGLAFHPRLPLLATVGSDLIATREELDTLVHIWEMDLNLLLGEPATAKMAPPAVHHTTAKIVLVGDSGVGKTGLGWRLAKGAFREHPSTHGQQFWVLPALSARRDDGTECEAIIWDLAGQPDYRLIHALFLDDADLALVLFDPTDSRDPLRGVEFWLKQLHGPPAILVGARVDRGAPTVTREELNAFCRQHGIRGGFINTSAKNGDGLHELLARMRTLIPWDQKTTTVTTVTFKRIKNHVLSLKQQVQGREHEFIVSPQTLRVRLESGDRSWEFTDAEMMTAVGHLANYGYVYLLRTSQGEQRILLAPELLNNLAASFVLEARRNLRGLGSIEEERLLAGEYLFPELNRLSPEECAILLDAAALLFLEHNICFRETDPLSGEAYLVFPELINLKKPQLDDEIATEDGPSYTVSGAVENVYASLVVLLGYTHTFTRTDQWRNHARYTVGEGLICGFRLDAERDGELDFVLYFGTTVGQPVRTLFQGLFESFLARRNLTVFRYEPVVCSKCRHALDRTVVRDRIRDGKDFAFCSECGIKLPLPKGDEPIQLTHTEHYEVEEQQWFAAQRTLFEQAVFQVLSYVEAQQIPRPACFISYAWGEPAHERWVERTLAPDLQKAGIAILLDRWENTRVGASVSRFIERIEKADRIMVVGTPLYRQKYENKVPERGYVVAAEVDLISNRLMSTESLKETVLPLLLSGEKETSLPPLLHGRVFADFREERAYFITAFDLILSLYQIPFNDPAVADLRMSLLGDLG